jgi:uncharacterized membrane protein YeaQ/YmgE (transglycosylase-associated protein family)
LAGEIVGESFEIVLGGLNMDLLTLIIVGLIAGWLAGLIMKGSGYGIIGDIILGILGSIIGNWAFSLIGIGAYGIIGNIIIAIVGAVILIFIARLLKGL